jgi:uncharacterized protein
MSQLGDALFTTTQQQVLALLYGQPERSFYTKEILRLTGMGVATIKRELDRMLAAGILSMNKVGNQHHYQANPECPIYNELLGIVKKTIGITGVLRAVLAPLTKKITLAFVFGSVASGKERAGSDIDLLLVGTARYTDVVNALYPAQELLGREINPKLYSGKEWAHLKRSSDPFFKELMAQPQLDVIGSKHESRKSRR